MKKLTKTFIAALAALATVAGTATVHADPPIKLEGDYIMVSDIVWLEARGESAKCQRAVAEVIYNRLESGIWGLTPGTVIFAWDEWSNSYEFSSVELLDTVVRDETWQNIYTMVSDVFTGQNNTLPERVLYFRADRYHSGSWAVPEFSIDSTYFSSSIWHQ